jgi:hypothetical protein
MIHKRLILLMFILMQCALGRYLFETNSEFRLKNEHVEIYISKKTANITAIITKGINILSREGTVNIDIHSKSKEKIIKIDGEDHYPKFAKVSFKKELAEISFEYKFIIDSLALRWEVEVVSKTANAHEAAVNFKIPVVKSMNHVFYPGQEGAFPSNEISEQIRTYRKSFLIPLFCVYNDNENYGLSVITPFEIPKPGLLFTIDKENMIVTYEHLRLLAKKKLKAAIYIVPHEGDWRPGLNFLVNIYPEYFHPAVENTKIGEGWYLLGGPFIEENRIVQVKNRGVTWIEMHGHFPFYGLYVPKQKDWGIIMNSDIISLNDWEKGAGEKRNSYEYMQNRISLWHKYGIQVYLYFQSFEAWHQYAKKYFAEDIALDKKGNLYSAWQLCNLMNPDPTSKWGEYIINQAEDLMRKYPTIDGIFFDRMDYWKYDFAHSDVTTMIDDTPSYMLGFALEKINEAIFDIFHKNKKGIWGNVPTSIEVCKNLDGIMVEVWPSALYKTQYLGIVRPIIFLPKDKTLKETETKLKNALLCGAYPSITFGDVECQKLDEKYVPLFDFLKNREWVLSKNPIETPEGFKGNIFRTPTGDYVVVIISLQKSQLVPHPFEYNIPITINVPNAEEIKYAHLLSGDWEGINSLGFRIIGKSIKINLPFHLSSSMIHLTKDKKFPFVRLSPPILIKGKKEELVFQIRDLNNIKSDSFEINTPWFEATKKFSSDIIALGTVIPESVDGEVAITITYTDKEHKMSCWILDPISIAPKEAIFIHEVNQSVPFMMTNNLNRKVTVELDGAFSKGLGKINIPQKITMQPFESMNNHFHITTETDGEIYLDIKAEGKTVKHSFSLKTILSPGANDLFFENFNQGMNNWTINRGEWKILNGIAHGSGSSHFAFLKNSWGDYIFEITTRCIGSDDPAVDWLKSYIFFRLQDEKNFYRFGIHGDAGIIDLHKCVDGNWIRIGSSVFNPEKDKWYALKIQVKGTKIFGFINSVKFIEADDNTFLTGGIGIGVLEDAMKCDYKNIIVKRL